VRRRLVLGAFLVAALGATAGVLRLSHRISPPPSQGCRPVDRVAKVRPDYFGCVIPPNIAPLNFTVDEPGSGYCVRITAPGGDPIQVVSASPGIRIPLRRWKRLLSLNGGAELHFDVYVRDRAGLWRRFKTATVTVARQPIDPYLVYRVINVLYEDYVYMNLTQRNVENFDESLVLDSELFDRGCMNCHTFYNHGTGRMVLHVRSGLKNYGYGMLLIKDGTVTKIDTRTPTNRRFAAFTSWHPSGRLIAFSNNKIRQFFHWARTDVREGLDLDSDISIYLFDQMKAVTTPALSDPDYLESWPEWSPDGRYLYFCRAPVLWSDRDKVPPENYEKCRYDLVRIGYDVETGRWGSLETVLSAEQTGMSISQPRFSPDGRFLVFCMSDHSAFPTFQRDADLYLMDMRTGQYRRMECNSDRTESWHSWSTNGRWLAFASKRGDGLFMKAYFTYVDESGRAHKPFVLPQRDPGHYDHYVKLYQMPELVREPVPVRREQIASVIRSAPWMWEGRPVTGATPRAGVTSGGPAGWSAAGSASRE